MTDLDAALPALAAAPAPCRQGEVVVLRYLADLADLSDLAVADLGARLATAVGSVKQHAHRGVVRLRAEMQQEGTVFEHLDDPQPYVADDPLRSAVVAAGQPDPHADRRHSSGRPSVAGIAPC